ncbi:leucine-rich repeat protein [Listeria sp. FSL L7-1582]|uniref:MucBP domain-containing protein n=1 Tax=Listeria portnoyi TaxID=2713504 RepID=UPI00164DCF2F|nr:MucBP domain-containing protein [Listeria portnoyi]MBC6310084.1 leucine-rich repeat protein [Listeria portnoyi]
MLKKIFWLSFGFALALFIFPNVSSAATFGDFEYTVDGNEATITDYTGSASNVTIPTTVGDNNEYSVTTIGNSAFSSKGLTGVTIPNSVTTIGDGAFTINSLQELVLPNSVQTIGKNSFSVNQIDSLTLSTSLQNIPNFAFLSNKLKTVDIPVNIESIDASSFENNFITDITIRNPNVQLEYEAFAAQTILSRLIVPSDSVLPLTDYIHFQDASSQLTMDNLTVTDLSDGVTYDQAKNALVFSAEPVESTFSLYTGTNRFDSYYDISEYGPSGIPIILFEYTKPIIITYKDASGTELASSTRLDGRIGEAYTSSPQAISGYTLKETPENATGQFTKTTQNVTYIYEKNVVQNGTVTVKYQDEAGTSLANDTTLTGEVGTAYQTNSKNISGYKLKEVDGSESGMFGTDPTAVTYIYEKIATTDDSTNGETADNNTNGESTDNNTTNTNSTTPTSEITQPSSSNTSNILPATGDTNNTLPLAIGSILTLLSTSILFFKRD